MKAEASLIHVRVTPDSRRESITAGKKSGLVICVKEPAQDNRANTRVRQLLADRFHVPLTAVRISSGHTRPNKLIRVVS